MTYSRRTLLCAAAGSASVAGAGRNAAWLEPCPTTHWTINGSGPVFFPSRFYDDPSLVSDPLVVGSDSGTVRAIDVSDGSTLWQVDAGSGPVVPVPAEDSVFVADGSVVALDGADGSERWTTEIEGSPGSPVVTSDALYVVGDGSVHALGRGDGRIRWRTDAGSPVTGRPVVGDDTLFLATSNAVVALDRETGQPRWERPVDGTNPLRLGGTVGDGILAWQNGRLLAIGGDGEERWRLDTGRRSHLPLTTVGEGTIYVAGRDLLALDSTDGTVEWRTPLRDEPRYPPPAVIDGTVYAGTETSVYAVNAAIGARSWRFDRGRDATQFWGRAGSETVLVPGGDGVLHVVDATMGRRRWRFDPEGRVHWAERLGDVVMAGTVDGAVHAVEPSGGVLETAECEVGTGGALAIGGSVAIGGAVVALLAGVRGAKWFRSSE